jgi:allantoinase
MGMTATWQPSPPVPEPTTPPRPDGILAPSADHGWFAFSPIPDRPPLSWPGGQSIAVSVVFDLRAVEWEEPENPPAIRPPGGRGVAPYPDFPRMGHREFGHRVGVFRLLEITRSLEIAPAAVIDVLTVEEYSPLLVHLQSQVSEFIAGGLSASRSITSLMSEDEERHYIATTLERLSGRLGQVPTGWMGPEHSESARTPGLLAEVGLEYVADWGNDEQPYPMDGLWSFPLSWELSDLRAMHERGVSPEEFGRSVEEAFEVLRGEGARSGRVLALHLHPWVSGRAFRAEAVERALGRLRESADIWWAPPGQVVEWCRTEGRGR